MYLQHTRANPEKDISTNILITPEKEMKVLRTPITPEKEMNTMLATTPEKELTSLAPIALEKELK